MKQIVITPANDADAERIAKYCEELTTHGNCLQTVWINRLLAEHIARCTAVTLTGAPVPGWDKAGTDTPDICTRMLDCRADILTLLELIPEYKPGFVPDQVSSAAQRILAKLYPDSP